jgi:hypothetical protein
MATTKPGPEVTLLMDIMEEAWKRLKPLIHTEVRKASKGRSLRDTERLLLLSGQQLFCSQYDKLLDADIQLRGELRQPKEFTSRASVERCAHRFLCRSYKCLQSFADFYLRHMKKSKQADDHLLLVRSQFKQAQDMAQRLILGKLMLSPEQGINCRRQSCESVDHFHSVDRLTWPSHQRQLEQNIPLPSKTAITFRDFNVSIPTHEPVLDGCFASLMDALGKSLKYANEMVPPFPLKDDAELIEDLEDDIFSEDLPDALCTVAHAILTQFELASNQLRLGIILPGGSQVFWPELTNAQYATKVRSVYIKANYAVENKTTMLSFLPVKTEARPKNAQLTQTVEFEQLPPEIRNMIYGYILDRESQANFPRRQPPIALTSRLVHKEVMSLLFKKYGWFVMI